MQIRVGVNSGEVVVRAIGSDLHMDYTAVGQTTHLAARMEQMAKPGSALITGATLYLAEGYVHVRPLGAVPVKGLETPTPVYELTGAVPARSRLQASAARGLTRFVGRDRELEQLGQALERAAGGHGQAVAVVGEAGVGKSRLAWEFIRSHRTQGWLVLESGSVSYGKATPYLPVIELLKGYCRIQERDEPRAIRERVVGKLLTLDRALEQLQAPLLALLDVPVGDSAWDALDRAQRRQRTLDAVKQLLLRESQVQPLLLLFEDLHWIDSETQAFLDGLIESLPTARILLLVNYRPEYEHAWGRKTYYLQLRIDPLPPQSADALLTALLGEERGPRTAQARVGRANPGEPLLPRGERPSPRGDPGARRRAWAYRVATPPDAWQIPATAQAILAARIDRLVPEDKRILQAAAVIGKDVPFALLQAIADAAGGRPAPGSQPPPGGRVPVRDEPVSGSRAHLQARVHPRSRRTEACSTTVGAPFTPGSCKPSRPSTAERVDRAHRAAGRPRPQGRHVGEGSGPTCVRQEPEPLTRSANQEAVASFEQSLTALSHMPETRETVEQGVDLRLALRRRRFGCSVGFRDWLSGMLRDAEHLAEKLGDQRRRGWIAAYLAEHTRPDWARGGRTRPSPSAP